MTRGLNKEEAAVNARVCDIAVALRRQFLAKVRRVLILDILDDGIPAKRVSKLSYGHGVPIHLPAVVVDLVAVAGRVNDV